MDQFDETSFQITFSGIQPGDVLQIEGRKIRAQNLYCQWFTIGTEISEENKGSQYNSNSTEQPMVQVMALNSNTQSLGSYDIVCVQSAEIMQNGWIKVRCFTDNLEIEAIISSTIRLSGLDISIQLNRDNTSFELISSTRTLIEQCEQQSVIDSLKCRISEMETQKQIEQQVNTEKAQNLKDCHAAIQKLNDNIKERDKQINQLRDRQSQIEGQNQFYQQEIKVLRSELVQIENSNKKLQQDLAELTKKSALSQDEMRELFYREKLQNQQSLYEKCQKENHQWQLLNDQLLREIQTMQIKLTEESQRAENCSNELNSFKKKYESLQQEIHGTRSRKQSLNGVNSDPDDEEIKRLKVTIHNLEITLKKYSIQQIRNKESYESDMLKLINKDQSVLSKLANSLAETILERDMALETQRNINKQLVLKLQESKQ